MSHYHTILHYTVTSTLVPSLSHCPHCGCSEGLGTRYHHPFLEDSSTPAFYIYFLSFQCKHWQNSNEAITFHSLGQLWFQFFPVCRDKVCCVYSTRIQGDMWAADQVASGSLSMQVKLQSLTVGLQSGCTQLTNSKRDSLCTIKPLLLDKMRARSVILLTGWWFLWTQKSSSVYSAGPLVGFSVPPIGHNEMVKTTAQMHNESESPLWLLTAERWILAALTSFLTTAWAWQNW